MDVRETPFVWGEHDCCLMAAKMLDATRGTDYVSRVRARFNYHTAAEGVRLMKDGLQPLLVEILGEPRPAAWCGMGDVVLVRVPESAFDLLAIHDGTYLLGADTEGLRKVPREFAVCGWSP